MVRTRYHKPGETIDVLVRYGIYLVERLTELVRIKGADPKFVCIYDRRGSSSENRDSAIMKFTLKFVKLLQDYYAERLGVAYILGASWMFRTFYALLKPFLSEKTKQKVVIIQDTNQMLDHFSAD